MAAIVFFATVRFRAEDAIRHQAMHDPLTGLSNRALFNDRLEQALTRRARTDGCVAVMIVDLDGFKHVNDSLGHLVGDALLIAVADRFRSRLRESDTIARLGGDEFAILVDSLDAADRSGPVAQRVLDALVDPLPLPGQEVAIGASVGIALTDDGDDHGRPPPGRRRRRHVPGQAGGQGLLPGLPGRHARGGGRAHEPRPGPAGGHPGPPS